ncbi:MAG: IPT/TIG domain-containing protein, partial [Bacteroidota bacterium]
TPYNGTGSFNVTAGAYSYTVTDANGCTALANTLISQPSPIIISTFNPTVANQGEPFTLYGNGLSNVTSLLFNNIPATNLIIFGDTVITTSVPATAIDGPITVLNQNGCSATSSQNFDYLDYYGNVDLKLFIEGYFDNGNMVAAMTNRGIGTNTLAVDSTFLFLADSSDPSIIIDSAKAILDISGSASFQYRGVHVGRSYYLIIRTMNTIETWSAQPVLLSTQTIYDFTDAANKAYGDNMTEIAPGVWAIYSGELNADGFIDSFDAVFGEADNIAFAAGYLPTDLNGDGFVDTFDSPFLEQNNLNFVSSLRP